MPNLSTKLTSPATLYLFGVAHTIALDGTVDGKAHDNYYDKINLLIN